jgi:GDP-D-mannose dehydratase
MAIDQGKLLDASKVIDANLGNSQTKRVVDALKVLANQSYGPGSPGVHPEELDLSSQVEDPFGGNTNNRKVAERISKLDRRMFTHNNRPIHMGDPSKAKADVALSKQLNPEVVIEEEDPEVVKPTIIPSPGSPAALKRAAPAVEPDKSTLAPPAWKPNA